MYAELMGNHKKLGSTSIIFFCENGTLEDLSSSSSISSSISSTVILNTLSLLIYIIGRLIEPVSDLALYLFRHKACDISAEARDLLYNA